MNFPFHIPRNTKSVFYHACYATLNASCAIFLASFGLTHFEKKVQINVKDTNKWNSSNYWEIHFPSNSMYEVSQSISSHTTKLLGATISPHLLNGAAGVSILTSVFFANESLRHIKFIWHYLN